MTPTWSPPPIYSCGIGPSRTTRTARNATITSLLRFTCKRTIKSTYVSTRRTPLKSRRRSVAWTRLPPKPSSTIGKKKNGLVKTSLKTSQRCQKKWALETPAPTFRFLTCGENKGGAPCRPSRRKCGRQVTLPITSLLRVQLGPPAEPALTLDENVTHFKNCCSRNGISQHLPPP